MQLLLGRLYGEVLGGGGDVLLGEEGRRLQRRGVLVRLELRLVAVYLQLVLVLVGVLAHGRGEAGRLEHGGVCRGAVYPAGPGRHVRRQVPECRVWELRRTRFCGVVKQAIWRLR